MSEATEAITEREAAQVERANMSGKTPVVFIHWLCQVWVAHLRQESQV